MPSQKRVGATRLKGNQAEFKLMWPDQVSRVELLVVGDPREIP